jgi:hypothetical protein
MHDDKRYFLLDHNKNFLLDEKRNSNTIFIRCYRKINPVHTLSITARLRMILIVQFKEKS